MMEVKVGMGNVRNEKEEKNKQGTFGKEKSTHKKNLYFFLLDVTNTANGK